LKAPSLITCLDTLSGGAGTLLALFCRAKTTAKTSVNSGFGDSALSANRREGRVFYDTTNFYIRSIYSQIVSLIAIDFIVRNIACCTWLCCHSIAGCWVGFLKIVRPMTPRTPHSANLPDFSNLEFSKACARRVPATANSNCQIEKLLLTSA